MHCSSKKFERMAREATDKCLRVLKESNKLKVGSTATVVTEEQCIDHIPYYLSIRDCCLHIFPTISLEIAVLCFLGST